MLATIEPSVKRKCWGWQPTIFKEKCEIACKPNEREECRKKTNALFVAARLLGKSMLEVEKEEDIFDEKENCFIEFDFH